MRSKVRPLVPTLRVGTYVRDAPRRAIQGRDAERPSVCSHAERGNESMESEELTCARTRAPVYYSDIESIT
jgi:hypothetical protein